MFITILTCVFITYYALCMYYLFRHEKISQMSIIERLKISIMFPIAIPIFFMVFMINRDVIFNIIAKDLEKSLEREKMLEKEQNNTKLS